MPCFCSQRNVGSTARSMTSSTMSGPASGTGPEDEHPARSQLVGQAVDQRLLGTDDDEVGHVRGVDELSTPRQDVAQRHLAAAGAHDADAHHAAKCTN